MKYRWSAFVSAKSSWVSREPKNPLAQFGLDSFHQDEGRFRRLRFLPPFPLEAVDNGAILSPMIREIAIASTLQYRSFRDRVDFDPHHPDRDSAAHRLQFGMPPSMIAIFSDFMERV
ncbi:MAG: hypothetical protein Q8M76_01300 [Spirochaetaceae bacterium]|nr:hypothetical protein [Spirochaetaceae bacterium]